MDQMQQQLERMVREVKQTMKPKSKNELIRIISALALDNFILKAQLQEQTVPEKQETPNE